MQHQEVTPEDLTDLEKNILLEVRMVKRVDPTFPVTRLDLSRRLGRQRRDIQAALSHLHEEFHLVGPLVLDPQDVELTAQGEVLAEELRNGSEEGTVRE